MRDKRYAGQFLTWVLAFSFVLNTLLARTHAFLFILYIYVYTVNGFIHTVVSQHITKHGVRHKEFKEELKLLEFNIFKEEITKLYIQFKAY